MIVVQLAELSIQMLEVRGSNPVIDSHRFLTGYLGK